MMISCSSVMFAQKYAQYISEARKYEDQKRWCYAMGAYFDAVEAAESLLDKQEASKKYDELKDVILDGHPGFGKFNDFTFILYGSYSFILKPFPDGSIKA